MNRNIVIALAVILLALLIGGGTAWRQARRHFIGRANPAAVNAGTRVPSGGTEEYSPELTENELEGGGEAEGDAPASTANNSITLSESGSAEEVAVAVATPTPTPAPPVIVRGKVIDKSDAPIEGAEVSWSDGSAHQHGLQTTDAEGRFELEIPATGAAFININAWKRGYSADRKTVRLAAPPDELILVLGDPQYITGEVVGPNDEKLEGAEVALISGFDTIDVHDRVQTDETGAFRFEINRLGSMYSVRASKRGFVPKTKPAQYGQPIIIKLDTRGALLSVQVVDEEKADPVAGAKVSLLYATYNPESRPLKTSGTTGADGTVVFEDLPPGNISVQVMPPTGPRGQFRRQEVTLAEGDVQSVTVRLPRPKTVVGTVRDKETNEPIAGVEVKGFGFTGGYNDNPSDVTNESGQYRLNPLFGRAVTITARKDGWLQDQDGTHAYGVPFTPEIDEYTFDLVMSRTVSVSGVVVHADGRPATEGTVNSAPIQADGTFKRIVPINTRTTMVAKVPGYPEAKSELIYVGEEDITGIRIVVPDGLEISGVVQDHEGKPVSKANVKLIAFADTLRQSGPRDYHDAMSDAAGAFRCSALTPGIYRLRASAEGHGFSEEVEVKLENESVRDVILSLRTHHFIAGSVVDQNEKSLPDASVYVSNNERSFGQTNSDANGNFRIEGLPPGKVMLHWNKTGYRHVDNEYFDVDRDDIVLRLVKGEDFAIIGRVLDFETREPVKGLKVLGAGTKVTVDQSADGIFIVENIQANFLTSLVLSADGYPKTTVELRVIGAEPVQEQEFYLRRGGSISGKIVARGTGEPVARARVTGTGWLNRIYPNVASPVMSREDGSFLLENLTPGEWSLQITPIPPFKEQVANATVTMGKSTDIGTIEVGTGNTVHVQVVKKPGDVPVPGLTVEMSGEPPLRQITNSAGVAKFTGLSAVDDRIVLPKQRIDRYFKHDSSGETTVKIVIGSANMRVAVVDEEGGYDARIHIGGRSSYELNLKAVSELNDNSYEILENVPPGTYYINCNEVRASSQPSTRIEVPETGVVDAVIDLRGATIGGIVLSASGEPVSGASVCVNGPDSRNVGCWNTGPDGKFRISPIKAGTYQIEAYHFDFGEKTLPSVSVNGDIDKLELRLSGPTGGKLTLDLVNSETTAPIDRIGTMPRLVKPDGSRPKYRLVTYPKVRFFNVEPGTYTLVLAMPEYLTHEQIVTFSDGEHREMTIRLTKKPR